MNNNTFVYISIHYFQNKINYNFLNYTILKIMYKEV